MAEEKEQSAGVFALLVTLKILGVLLSLYLFLFGLDLMGGSFSALGSKGAGNLFTFSDNPIAGSTCWTWGLENDITVKIDSIQMMCWSWGRNYAKEYIKSQMRDE